MSTRSMAKKLAFSAVMMAVSAVIYTVSGLIPFLNLPFGGTVTVASLLPIIIVAYMYGVKWGAFTAFSYSLLRVALSLMQGASGAVTALFLPGSDFTVVKALAIVFLDYIAAYSVLFVGGLFRKMKSQTAALLLGSIVALICSLAFHVISGAVFYGEWAEWFFTETSFANLKISAAIMENAGASLGLVYSLIYNSCYMIPETVITAICAAFVSRIPQIKKC
ncbi:MAG: energy-coupled thiamine transporter ThiT [Clostridiales bacterium]|nr:energy-coupled thiamine transporter ThiT [Clostridiales bacterium]